jgi:branched-subunit amino acid transport protein
MNIYIYIGVMAVTTYLVRALPLTLFKKPIRNRFLKSFLHYVPAACLTTMTFPAILFSTGEMAASVAGFAAALILAFQRKSLIVVASVASLAALLAELLLAYL